MDMISTEEEEFTIISDNDIYKAEKDEHLDAEKENKEELALSDREIREVISETKELGVLSERDISEVVTELRQLEEKLHLWREVRKDTIRQLREIADYIDGVARKTGIAKVVGSSGGVLAGGLTLAGGVMTVLTAGAALPVLAAGAGLGLASGLTGASAALSKKILSSKQMSRVQLAIEVDSNATKELESEVEIIKNDKRIHKVTEVVFTVGGLASSTKGVLDIIRGATPGQTIIGGLEAVSQIFGESVNKEIVKLLARTSGQVLSGTVTSVFGGVTMLWDMYQLKSGVQQLADGSEEGAQQIRDIATQLEVALTEFTEHQTQSEL